MGSVPLREFIERHERLFVLTGAGCSTASGIPDYRDANGEWKRTRPVMLQAFLADDLTRKRYWARSLVGWQRMHAARPNGAHHALAALESAGRVEQLVTQNVDGLHQAAGSRNVIDLHGRIDAVRCLACGARVSRAEMQAELVRRNPRFASLDGRVAPDGDADLEDAAFAEFVENPVAAEQEHDVVRDGDALEIRTNDRRTDDKLLRHDAASKIDLGDLRTLVALREQASVRRQGNARDLVEILRQHPARDRSILDGAVGDA